MFKTLAQVEEKENEQTRVLSSNLTRLKDLTGIVNEEMLILNIFFCFAITNSLARI
jgi:hypothetical protein